MNNGLCWYESYSLNLDISLNSASAKINEYLTKLSNKTDEKNVETKINMIEKDYLNKLKDMEELCKNSEKVNELKSMNSLLILQKEVEFIKLITKYTLQNKSLDYKFFIDCLTILLNLSETLRVRLGQKEIVHDKTTVVYQEDNGNIISRCSYKFCSYQDNCTYNYNLKTKNLCYQDHYVHNMVSSDLKILLNYIKNQYEKSNLVLHNKEILKTINTLSFVIGHMETELRTKCLYLPENEWEQCHVVKNK
jgi:REP element-mobilizing transposase RayT